MHHGGRSDSAVDAVHEYPGADRMSNRSEFWLLVCLPSRRGQLSRERARQPFPDLRRDRVRLHFRQLVIFIRQPSVGQTLTLLLYISLARERRKITTVIRPRGLLRAEILRGSDLFVLKFGSNQNDVIGSVLIVILYIGGSRERIN